MAARKVTVYFRDGRPPAEWPEQRQNPVVRTEGAFVIVTDGYNYDRLYPADLVERVDVEPQPRGGW